jgi:hypothetical protein
VQVRAGRVLWPFFTPTLGFIALLALATSFGTPLRHLAWGVAATGLLLLVRSRPWSTFGQPSSE